MATLNTMHGAMRPASVIKFGLMQVLLFTRNGLMKALIFMGFGQLLAQLSVIMKTMMSMPLLQNMTRKKPKKKLKEPRKKLKYMLILKFSMR